MRAVVMSLLFASGCTEVDLQPGDSGPPFTCTDGGKCPSGYDCKQQLCIRVGDPDPPMVVATTSIDDAPGLPLWTGSGFAVAWHDSTQTTLGPGVRLMDIAANASPALVVPSVGALTFAAIYETTTSRYVLAVASNGITGSLLTVVDTPAPSPTPRTDLTRTETYSPVGFSQPSLATREDGTVTLAYTLTVPPSIVTQNLFCARIDLSNATVDMTCAPSARVQAGLSASSVAVGEFTAATVFAWRAGEMQLTGKTPSGLEMSTTMPNLVTVEKLVYSNAADHAFAMIGQSSVISDMGVEWGMFIATSTTTTNGTTQGGRVLSSTTLVPDVSGDGTRFFACVPDAAPSTGASILTLETADGGAGLTQTSSRELPRYSSAPIESCHVVVGGSNLGILWRERTPPATGTLYFATIPLDPPT